ncbi:MAG: ABC transporter ATP-binding protein [Desulfobulbaceae bacterium]|nr:ABC transporter ATP-binding protein [Desulfobulbaceae bacterium]
MNNDLPITVDSISKAYKLYTKPIDRLKESFNPFRKKYHKDFFALRDVSFAAKKGEVVGIIGKNGSGKSTLLQIITGVLTPTAGSVDIRGRVSALLELGAGFNPELSGIENVYFKSSLLGFSTSETDAKIDDILAFAGIGEFIKQPVKTYSSGMFVRLAFAVAINVDPDILIIDEALSVGDFRFQQKCLRKIKEFKENNKTILFVSHSTHSVIEFCDRALWLMDGMMKDIGPANTICQKYMAYMSSGEDDTGTHDGSSAPNEFASIPHNKLTKEVEWESVSHCGSFGDGGAEITAVCLAMKGETKRVKAFEGGARVVFYVKIAINVTIEQPIVGFHLCDSRGVHILGMNTYALGLTLGTFHAGETKIVAFEFDFPFLHIGNYAFSPAIANGTQLTNVKHHWIHDAYLVDIQSTDINQKLGHYLVIKDNVDVTCSNM